MTLFCSPATVPDPDRLWYPVLHVRDPKGKSSVLICLSAHHTYPYSVCEWYISVAPLCLNCYQSALLHCLIYPFSHRWPTGVLLKDSLTLSLKERGIEPVTYWWQMSWLFSRLWTTAIAWESCIEMWSPTTWWLIMNTARWVRKTITISKTRLC